MKATLTCDGQIKLPIEIQTQLGLKPGDDVILEAHNGVCVIRASDASTGLQYEGNVLVHRGISEVDADAVLSKVREQRLNELGEGVSP